MASHDFFYFVRIDVKTRHQNHIFFAINDGHISVVSHDTDITSTEESICCHDFGSSIFTVPVTFHYLWTTNTNLTALTKCYFITCIIQNRHICCWHRYTNGTCECLAVARIRSRYWCCFRQAVTLNDNITSYLTPFFCCWARARTLTNHIA